MSKTTTSKNSYKERARQRREHEILCEAGRLIRERGVADLNMDSVAEAVGISKPTLYQHFKSKEDLMANVLIWGMSALEAELNVSADDPPLTRLQNAIRHMLRNRYRPEGRMSAFGVELLVSMRDHPDVVARKTSINGTVRAIVEEGKQRGEITETLPTAMIVAMLFHSNGLIHGASMMETPEYDIDTGIEYVVQIFTRAVQAECG